MPKAETYEGKNVDEILGEIEVVGDGTLSMTSEIPDGHGGIIYMPETFNFSRFYIIADDSAKDVDKNAKS